LLKAATEKDSTPISILYITPLRALNRDMLRRLEELCNKAKITIGVRHGDTTQKERNRQAKSAPAILITTPETLQSILPTKHIGSYLKNIKAVVVDELHELYYNKRGAQLSIALERLEELAPGFQRIGLSATIGDPQVVKSFLCGRRDCTIVKVDAVKEMRLSLESPTKSKRDLSVMQEKFGLDGPSLGRLECVMNLVSESGSSIIFANTRQVVESLGSRLLYLNSIHDFGGVGVHHSSLDKNERINIEDSFKAGKIKSIVATSSLELGIDIGSVDLVIQYGSPRQALRLAQRVGRSGHTHKGVSNGAVIATNPVEVLETCSIFNLAESGGFEAFKPQIGAQDVLVNQICGIVLDKASTNIDLIHNLLIRSYIYADLSKETLKHVLEFMSKLRLVGFDGKSVTGSGRTRMYYYDHLSVIPDSKRFIVKNAMENRIISTLDERFVANNVDEGSVFITKGLPWKVLSIDKDVISVEPSTDLEAAIPDWVGEDIPVSHDTVYGVFEILNGRRLTTEKTHISKDATKIATELIEKQKGSFLPSNNSLVVERLNDYSVLYTGLGTQANEAFSRLLARVLSLKVGHSINIRSSPYMVMLEVGRKVDIEKTIISIGSKDVEDILRGALADTELFRYKFVTIAKLFGIIDRDAVVSRSVAKRITSVMKESPVYEEAFREIMERYFDVKTLVKMFERIENGIVRIKVLDRDSPSALTKAILNSAYYTKELITPLTPNSELVESFAKFILSKTVKFLCTYCGFVFSRKLDEIKGIEKIKCESCGSPIITFYDDEYLDVVIKRIKSSRLNKNDATIRDEMLKYANLIDSYGARAAIALSVYGIGPRSAARALMMLKHDDKDFFIELIEAQKNFIRTKKYWSV
jgi:ATP-dependent helicase Lhr and Lhr-like helicase